MKQRIVVRNQKSEVRTQTFRRRSLYSIVCILLSALCFLSSPAFADVFGIQMFTGKFSSEQFSGFNPNYQISIGDRITLKMWGAFTFEGTLLVDPQGNIFIPNVGPVKVQGVRNAELNPIVEANIQKVYRSNVGVYASLEAAQPVKVFVTGFVKNPGLYGGLSSDSILYYLDKAGGVDPERGSFIDISLMRGENVRKKINLYDFLLNGKLDLIQMLDGDTIVVGPRKHIISFSGEVYNAFQFEFADKQISINEALSLARPKPAATHISIVRKQGVERKSEYYSLDKINNIMLNDGDEVGIFADKYPATILVRIEGAHSGEHALILPYGATMKDVISRIVPNQRSNLESVQLFRKSVAKRQKEMLLASLQSLETHVLTARSATSDEASLRAKEAEMVMKFVERARNIEPKGQIVLGSKEDAQKTLLEDGDVVHIPETTSSVMVHGEVLFPNAILHKDSKDIDYYIEQAGGYTQNADKARVIVLQQNGKFKDKDNMSLIINPGDEILALPKVEVKRIEVAKGISQIIYQLAIAAKVALGL